MNIVIRTLQIGGFIVAFIGLFHDQQAMFILGFATHVTGDILFIRKNGL